MQSTSAPSPPAAADAPARCQGKKTRGGLCQQLAVAGRTFCLDHDPETGEARRAKRSQHMRRINAERVTKGGHVPAAPAVELRSAEGLFKTLERAVALVESSEVSANSKATSLTRIAQIAIKVRELALEEQDVAKLAAEVEAAAGGFTVEDDAGDLEGEDPDGAGQEDR